jgi:3-deoxy-D-manno-octulosonic-acid transferase
MAEVAVETQGRDVIWYDRSLLTDVNARLFDPTWLHDIGYVTGHSRGRKAVWFLKYGEQDFVLRHYWRGGMAGRFIKDLYLRSAVPNSRAMREFSLLCWMHDEGLAVPRPVAARFRAAGLFYRADLLMQMIPNARPLADLLHDRALSEAEWMEAGAVIARMHSLGVDHSDLNCRNILFDRTGKFWLIDFDKCARRSRGAWTKHNLDRLERSFQKEKTEAAELRWSELDWGALLEGYRSERSNVQVQV